MLREVNSGFYNALKLYPETWASATAYALGELVKATTYNAHAYKCTTAGTTASVEPTWSSTSGVTITDNTAVWTTYDTKTYNVIAPQGSTVPYVTFGLLTETPMGEFQDFEAIENLTFWVNCFSSKSIADVCEISDEVMDVLDDATISASGFTNMKCVREFTGTTMWDMEMGIYQTPLIYRVWLDKS